MKRFLLSFCRDERGLETVEYAIISGLITGVAILAISAIGVWVALQFGLLRGNLPGA